MAFLSSISNILLIILGFGVLIFVHELGHFLAAKWAGIRTEAFAVGMGPVMIAWRKGVGVRFGSTWPAIVERARQYYMARGIEVDLTGGDEAERRKHIYRALEALNIGETEYSLRWLPIGGFVKMLGQEDANPNAVSDDPRSYTRCPVGKRMIVVSAGVIMNLLLAVALFIIAFTAGVKFEAPVVGDVIPTMQAASARADNADALGITTPGLQPGDRVLEADGDPAQTFADLSIASAMSRPNVPVRLTVQREGVSEPLRFSILPQKDPATGLLSFGILPGSSTTLQSFTEDQTQFEQVLNDAGLAAAAIQPGMRMLSAQGQPVWTYQQFAKVIEKSAGEPVRTEWVALNNKGEPAGPKMVASMAVKPDFQTLRYPNAGNDALPNFERGLFGMTPLVKIGYILPGSRNQGVLKEGDVVLRVGEVEAPRLRDFFEAVQKHKPGPIDMVVLRDGQEVALTAMVVRKGLLKSTGMLNVAPEPAWETPLIAMPMERIGVLENNSAEKSSSQDLVEKATPAASLRLLGRDRITQVGGVTVNNWIDIRRELRTQTRSAFDNHRPADVELTIVHPTPGNPQESLTLHLSADHVATLHELAWHSEIGPWAFEPIYTVLTSGGNPLRAIGMGFHRTYTTVVLTYLTIDRLFRGSVGISQLRGPVGIVHIGAKVADRGFLYILFFLGMISVNLAVINFLPMPIVDGGLFLFLIYEKIKGTPPPLAFQNAATIIGICMIGALFLITFYNDVMRLLS